MNSAVNEYISLREAAGRDANLIGHTRSCSCSNGCVDRRCGCVKRSKDTKRVTLCSVNCHKGIDCQNMSSRLKLPLLPAYGGTIIDGANKLYFSNTCPVDWWIALLKVVQEQYPAVLERLVRQYSIGQNSILMVFVGYIRHDFFEKAKLVLAKHCNLMLRQSTYDFLGNEVEYVLRNFTFLVENTCNSSCSNGSLCPEPTKFHSFKDFPALTANEVGQFQQVVDNWMKNLHVSSCQVEITGQHNESVVEWIPRR